MGAGIGSAARPSLSKATLMSAATADGSRVVATKRTALRKMLSVAGVTDRPLDTRLRAIK